MPFPKKLLNDFEEIVLDLRPHWFFFFEPVLAAAVTLIIMVIIAALSAGTVQKGLLIVAGIALVGLIGWIVVRYLKWVTTNFVVTTDRLIYRSGVFAKKGIQIPLERVNNVIFRQNFWERVIGAGDLIIESAGQEGRQSFSDVRHPDQVQNVIYREMELNENKKFDRIGDRMPGARPVDSRGNIDTSSPAMPPPPPAPAGMDVATQLEKLEGLLQRGSITQAEYDAQKQKLLGTA
jgi:membrane protein YdbS with pleckstrin-like domain